MTKIENEKHRQWIRTAAANPIAIADITSIDIVTVIATMERHIVEGTKVGDAAKMPPLGPDRFGYTLIDGRLVLYSPEENAE